MTIGQLWVGIGLVGEAQFGGRFILQWLASERVKRSIVPRGFWVLSTTGGITMLSYAIYRLDPVFIAGEAFGLLVFARNLWLSRRRASPTSSGPGTDASLAGPVARPSYGASSALEHDDAHDP
jgi:lipid-A-disaccharide synthase-like uncharacterized protein